MAQIEGKITDSLNGIKPAPKGGKRIRKYRSVGITSGGDLSDKAATYKVDTQGCEWDTLPTFAPFVTDPNDILIKVKDSRSSYICLKTNRHEIDIASGRVHRVYF